MNQEKKICQNCKSEFVIEPDDFAFYEKIQVPPPTWCPECRMKRRMIFRNEQNLFKRKCDLCRKEMITMYNPKEDVVVYCNDCWWSDKWDPMSYGKEYDFNVPFFTQFRDLLKKVPRVALEAYQNQNSPFTNYTWFAKNIYLSPSTFYSENIFYSHGITRSQDCIDCHYAYGSQLCYETVDSENCAKGIHLTDCKDCLDSAFLYDCRGCSSCFMSSGLRSKSFVFRNEELSKEEYEKKIKGLSLGDYRIFKELIAEFEKMKLRALHRFATMFKTVNSSGNNLINAKNARFCFTGIDLENVKYSIRAMKIKDSMDLYGVGEEADLLYEGVNVGYKDSLILMSINTFEGIRNATYCDYCKNSHDIFGCAGLRKKQYCILNKEYSKESFAALREKIIEHMNALPYTDREGRVYRYGEFFPPEFSLFAYNEAIVQEYFPFTKHEADAQHFLWREPDIKEYEPSMKVSDIPRDITQAPDSILGEMIECAHDGVCEDGCTIAFRILEQELQFYRRMNLPLPRLCPNCRRLERVRKRNPLNIRLWKRHCMCSSTSSFDATRDESPQATHKNTATHFHGDKPCPNEFETPYAPDRSEIVYCESCYQTEIV